MKQKSLFFAVLVLLVSNVFCIAGWNKSMNQVNDYHVYYMTTEDFLDGLDQHYGRVDAFDPEAYYDAVHKLRNIQ